MRLPFFVKIGFAISLLALFLAGISSWYFYGLTRETLILQKQEKVSEVCRLGSFLFHKKELEHILTLKQKIQSLSVNQMSDSANRLKPGSRIRILRENVAKGLMNSPAYKSLRDTLLEIQEASRYKSKEMDIKKMPFSNVSILIETPMSKDRRVFQIIAEAREVDPDKMESKHSLGEFWSVNSLEILDTYEYNMHTISHIRKDNKKSIFISSFCPLQDGEKQVAILSIDLDSSIIESELDRILFFSIKFVIAAFILSLALSYFIAYKISQPIKILSDKAEKLKEHNFDLHFYMKSRDEFQILADAFNSMLDDIRSYAHKIQSKNDSLKEQNNILAEIATSNSIESGNIELAANIISESVSKVLNVHTVSIWLLEYSEKFYCIDFYDVHKKAHSGMESLKRSEYPRYFAYLEKGAIVANDALLHPAMLEFRNDPEKIAKTIASLDTPIRMGKNLYGFISVSRTEVNKSWTQDEINFLSSLSEIFTKAIYSRETHKAREELKQINENLEYQVKERTRELNNSIEQMKRDLSIAKKIQDKILPHKNNRLSHLDYYYEFNPLDEVGGDIFDIYSISDSLTRLMLCDVIGHGIQASLITIAIKSEYEEIKRYDEKPSFVLKELNERFLNKYEALQTYFPCIVIDIDTQKNEIQYASAGHPEQLLLYSNLKQEWLNRTGPILGFLKEPNITDISFPFHSGDRIYLFSDGLSESLNAENEMFGEDNILETVIALHRKSIQEVVIELMHREREFRKQKFRKDDITILGIERK
ncbi:MAG: SpoIIE family protein phosphatase [Leptospiraceae bacterium]|nr:SpoIIE family protein phosphatase [Leptospiraceae bacterium]